MTSISDIVDRFQADLAFTAPELIPMRITLLREQLTEQEDTLRDGLREATDRVSNLAAAAQAKAIEHAVAAERERIRRHAVAARAVYCYPCYDPETGHAAACDHDDELAPFADLIGEPG